MNILLAASEVVPYAKTGGLADVAGALPKALARIGHTVRVIMPRYKVDKIEAISERLPGELRVPFNFGERGVSVFVDRSGVVPVYFIDSPEYFSRTKLYGDSDDAERFAFFSRAVLKAHDESNASRVGDRVLIEETRPMSKEKRWRIRKVLSRVS